MVSFLERDQGPGLIEDGLGLGFGVGEVGDWEVDFFKGLDGGGCVGGVGDLSEFLY